VNTVAPWPDANTAWARVLGIQTKLHQWAINDPTRRFDDLYNLVCDPAVLYEAWRRVKGNRGARSAGVDGQTAAYISTVRGEEQFLADLRADLKARTFLPLPVRERMIPKSGGKLRRLGIPTVRDRVVQAALKSVLEPIFEADFQPCSYGFRPKRRAQDAIAEIHHLASRSYEWVLEGDIKACFDEIDHTALMGRVRDRIGDKRILDLVKAFLKAGILSEGGDERDTIAGTPQGGILSPLLANVALSLLDDHFAEAWASMGATSSARHNRRRKGLATYRLVRYADDWVVVVAGTRAHAEGCGRRWRCFFARWACACRRRRRGSSTSTRASTSSDSASSGTRSAARESASSTPTLRRRHLPPSRRRCGARPRGRRTSRFPSCCTG